MAAGPVVLLLLLLVASVAVATSGTRCASDEYQNLGLCCKLCPAGHYLLQACSVNHTTGRCVRCEHGTFMSHPNREADCWPWTRCREDQEVVAAGSESSDQQCQCRSGRFYCDSEDCMESCFQCQRCDGLTLQACSATRNAVCATEVSPEPGKRPSPSPKSSQQTSREVKWRPCGPWCPLSPLTCGCSRRWRQEVVGVLGWVPIKPRLQTGSAHLEWAHAVPEHELCLRHPCSRVVAV